MSEEFALIVQLLRADSKQALRLKTKVMMSYTIVTILVDGIAELEQQLTIAKAECKARRRLCTAYLLGDQQMIDRALTALERLDVVEEVENAGK